MKWIKASERLPEGIGLRKDDPCLVVIKANGIYFSVTWLPIEKEFEVRHQPDRIAWNPKKVEFNIEWLDESDHSDEEAAFSAARKTNLEGLPDSDLFEVVHKYPTFTDYLKSKQEL